MSVPGVSVQGALFGGGGVCAWGSLSGGVSVQVPVCPGGYCPAVHFPGASVQGGLSGGRPPPPGQNDGCE